MKKTNIGGQAVIEGVMMRGKSMYAMAVRDTVTKVINIDESKIKVNNNKFYKLPLIRGVVAFLSSIIMGMKIISKSVEMAGLEEEGEPSKFEKYITEKFGDKLNGVIMGISVVFALVISVFLFMLLPVYISQFINPLTNGNTYILSFVEGIVRIIIFIGYIFLISRNSDIQRVFKYHGAEHKTINCYEHEEELTVENVKKHSRLHKRCGTSFLVFVMIISMLFFMLINTRVVLYRFLSRIIFVPLIAGVSYEVIKWAGNSDSKFVSFVSAPGMALQKITTLEPEDDQIECAIAAMERVLEKDGNF